MCTFVQIFLLQVLCLVHFSELVNLTMNWTIYNGQLVSNNEIYVDEISKSLGLSADQAKTLNLLEFVKIEADEAHVMFVCEITQDNETQYFFTAFVTPKNTEHQDKDAEMPRLTSCGKFMRGSNIDYTKLLVKNAAEKYNSGTTAFLEDWKNGEEIMSQNHEISNLLKAENTKILEKTNAKELLKFWILETDRFLAALYILESGDAAFATISVNVNSEIFSNSNPAKNLSEAYFGLNLLLEDELAFAHGWTYGKTVEDKFACLIPLLAGTAPWLPNVKDIKIRGVNETPNFLATIVQCFDEYPEKVFLTEWLKLDSTDSSNRKPKYALKNVELLGSVKGAVEAHSLYANSALCYKEETFINGVRWFDVESLEPTYHQSVACALNLPDKTSLPSHNFGIIPVSLIDNEYGASGCCIWHIDDETFLSYINFDIDQDEAKFYIYDVHTRLISGRSTNEAFFHVYNSVDKNHGRKTVYVIFPNLLSLNIGEWDEGPSSLKKMELKMQYLRESNYLPKELSEVEPRAFWESGRYLLIIVKCSLGSEGGAYFFVSMDTAQIENHSQIHWIGSLAKFKSSRSEIKSFKQAKQIAEKYARTSDTRFLENWQHGSDKVILEWAVTESQRLRINCSEDGYLFQSFAKTGENLEQVMQGNYHLSVSEVFQELKLYMGNSLLFVPWNSNVEVFGNAIQPVQQMLETKYMKTLEFAKFRTAKAEESYKHMFLVFRETKKSSLLQQQTSHTYLVPAVFEDEKLFCKGEVATVPDTTQGLEEAVFEAVSEPYAFKISFEWKSHEVEAQELCTDKTLLVLDNAPWKVEFVKKIVVYKYDDTSYPGMTVSVCYLTINETRHYFFLVWNDAADQLNLQLLHVGGIGNMKNAFRGANRYVILPVAFMEASFSNGIGLLKNTSDVGETFNKLVHYIHGEKQGMLEHSTALWKIGIVPSNTRDINNFSFCYCAVAPIKESWSSKTKFVSAFVEVTFANSKMVYNTVKFGEERKTQLQVQQDILEHVAHSHRSDAPI